MGPPFDTQFDPSVCDEPETRISTATVERQQLTERVVVGNVGGASEADPDLGFMARLLALCALPRTNPGNRLLYKRVNGPYRLYMQAGPENKLPFGNLPRLLLAWVCTEAVRTQNRVLVLGDSLSEFMRKLGMEDRTGSGRGGPDPAPQPDEAPLSLSD